MILSFRIDMPGQTVQTQIRLLLEEQSDQGLHCLPFHLYCLDSLLYSRATCETVEAWQFWSILLLYPCLKYSTSAASTVCGEEHWFSIIRKFSDLSLLSQSYNATVFYFDNITFLGHVLNQLVLPNKSSISQASYHTMFPTAQETKPFYGGRVVEKNEMNSHVPVSDMRHSFHAA